MRLRKTLFTLLFILFAGQQSLAQQHENFILRADPKNPTAKIIKQRLIEIKDGINNSDSWKDFSLTGDHPAVGLLNSLVDKHNIEAIRTTGNVRLIRKEDESYEVRELYVTNAPYNALTHQELVLHFSWKGQLIGAKLGEPIYNYQLVLDREIWATPGQSRDVKKHIKRYQAALTNGDTTVIDALVDPNALIIKGNIARYKHNGKPGPHFQYRRVSLQSYYEIITQLSKRPKIDFGQFDTYQHPKFKNVFVVTFKQSWETPSYSDKGYAVVILDMRGKDPRIMLKSWQSYPYDVVQMQYGHPYISDLPFTLLGAPYQSSGNGQDLQRYTPNNNTKKEGFFRKNRKWLLISAGATAAISVGVALLSGGGKSELPGPPGRPTVQ